MHTKADWIRAICECPQDDHLRLIYADWLEENGERERAVYIREGVLKEPHTHFNYHPNCPQWHPPHLIHDLRLLKRHYWKRMTFNRGMCLSIDLPTQAFMDHYETLFREQPIEEIQLTDRWSEIGYYLYDESETTESPKEENIPTEIFNVIWGWAKSGVVGIRHDTINYLHHTAYRRLRFVDFRGYGDDDYTKKILSQACVEWARRKVGLPSLKGGRQLPTDCTLHPANDSLSTEDPTH